MVGSEVFSSTRHKIYPSSSYRVHEQVVETTPRVLDADHDLFAPAETTFTVKASEFKAIQALVRRSLSVLSYIEHFDVTSTKLLQQLLKEVFQGSQESGHRMPRCCSISSCHRLMLSPILPISKLSFCRMWCWLTF